MEVINYEKGCSILYGNPERRNWAEGFYRRSVDPDRNATGWDRGWMYLPEWLWWLAGFSIRHQPSLSALPDKHMSRDTAFALLHLKDHKTTRLLEGPFPVQKIYDQGLRSQGHSGAVMKVFRASENVYSRVNTRLVTSHYPIRRYPLRCVSQVSTLSSH